MPVRLQATVERIQASLWFIPGIGVVTAAVAAELLLWLGGVLGDRPLPFLFPGGVSGARAMLQAIAGSTITVAGVAFSITVIALQLTSSQFSPRVLRSFLADRLNQTVLAVLIGTFTYCLLVLRTIRSEDEDVASFVPELAVTGAFVLALLSVAMLIAFIHHISSGIQVTSILDRITHDALPAIRARWPEEPAGNRATENRSSAAKDGDSAPPTVVKAPARGYLQDADTDELVNRARRLNGLIRVEQTVGDWVAEKTALMTVWADGPHDGDLPSLADSVTVGPQRIATSDVAFGVQQIVDIAVKALSPGVNDPTTAENAIHRLTDILIAAGNRHPPADEWRDEDGALRLVWPQQTFGLLVEMAYEQLIYDGAERPTVAMALAVSLRTILRAVPARNHAVLRAQAAFLHAAVEELQPPTRRAKVRDVLEAVLPPR